jgi:dihydroorotase
MMPPLREDEDVEALFKGIADKTIDAIASDHAPHDRDSKMVEFTKATVGILGLQTSLPLLVEFASQGKMTRQRMVELLCSGPAESFGLPYGTLKKGRDADIVVMNPGKKWIFSLEDVHSKSKNSPFLGREMTGVAETVLVGGRIVVNEGRLVQG